MKPLKGYAPQPLKTVVYWPVLSDKGALVSVWLRHAAVVNAPAVSFAEAYRVMRTQELTGPDVWWIGPSAGHIGNVYALREFLSVSGNPKFGIRKGLYQGGRGLWSLDIVEETGGEPLTRVCLRDAESIVGVPVPHKNPDETADAEELCTKLQARVDAAIAALNRSETPIGLTLSSSAAAWVRHELVPGGRGYARRMLSMYTRMADDHIRKNPEPNDGLATPVSEPSWMTQESKRPRRSKTWPDDPPNMDAWSWDTYSDEFATPAYYGGRVEAWGESLVRGRLYDIRSAYADAMRYPLPTKFLGVGAGEPPVDGFVIAKATVTVPSNIAIPPLPYRLSGGTHDGQVFYPTGTWDGIYTLEEICAAIECGASVKLGRWWHWEAAPWMLPYVSRWWEIRKRAALEGDDATLIVSKRMLNNLYGKFAQNDETEILSTDVQAYEYAIQKGLNPGRLLVPMLNSKLSFPLYRIPESRSAPLRHMAVAACISARARVSLLLAAHQTLRAGSKICVLNTDAIGTDGYINHGPDIGDFRLEFEFDRFESLSDRCYAFNVSNVWDIRANGFAVRRRDGESDSSYNRRRNAAWESLHRTGHANMEVPRSFRTGVRMGDIRYALETTRYVARDPFSIPKRIVDDRDGSTRPWDIGELRKHAGASA